GLGTGLSGSNGSGGSGSSTAGSTAGAAAGNGSATTPTPAGSAASGHHLSISSTVEPTPLSGTGLGTFREVALGVLCLGLALIIFGWTVKMRLESEAVARGVRG
ncbi:MAG TPA: hypothetical protein VED63_06790, partial [Acidimicrobiales bacterium]|nr:hypothetical protein [Acidimicrobiales bacterium]